MSSHKALIKKKQQVARLQSKVALLAKNERKRDTRMKIEFGGLVVKAGLSDCSKALVLGALIDAAEKMKSDSKYKTLFQSKGEHAFMGFGESE